MFDSERRPVIRLNPPLDRTPAAGDVRAALDRVCVSGPFLASPKLKDFLRFVVEATLAGRGDRLKGYTIGVEALGRPDNFDPQTDPIVRVEATRLRRALARYYAGEGARDPVVIDMPRGHYVAAFHRGAARAAAPPAWRQAIRVVVRVLSMRLVLQNPRKHRLAALGRGCYHRRAFEGAAAIAWPTRATG